jgi:hypothetical protein
VDADSIDRPFATFCASLPDDLREAAQKLPFRLDLAQRASTPWSETFKHAVTLTAPRLVVETMTDLSPDDVEMATTAHMLSVIEAFGTDRILDGQVAASVPLTRILDHARRHVAILLRSLAGTRGVALAADAHQRTTEAIAAERKILLGGGGVTEDTYHAVSRAKQTVGLPATVALLETGPGGAGRASLAAEALMGVWLGLQLHDDVTDWADDHARGGAWAVSLARHRLGRAGVRGSERRLVHESGVLPDLLQEAVEQFRIASEKAGVLGAHELARWASARADAVAEAAAGEATSPGYVARVQALAPWALEVLS